MKGRTKGRVSWAAARGAETPMEKSTVWVLVTQVSTRNLGRRHEEPKYFWSKRREVCITAYEDMNTMHWTIFKQHLSKK